MHFLKADGELTESGRAAGSSLSGRSSDGGTGPPSDLPAGDLANSLAPDKIRRVSNSGTIEYR